MLGKLVSKKLLAYLSTIASCTAMALTGHGDVALKLGEAIVLGLPALIAAQGLVDHQKEKTAAEAVVQ